MSGKTYFLVVFVGNIVGFVSSFIFGFYEGEIFSNPILAILGLAVFTYSLISLFTVWVDLYVNNGISMLMIGVILCGPVGAILYLMYLHLGETDLKDDKSHT